MGQVLNVATERVLRGNDVRYVAYDILILKFEKNMV